MIPKIKKFSNGNKVHPIGIGTWGIGGGMLASFRHDEHDIEAIKYSLKKGQNHIDTAEMYGAGHSEEVVGQSIKGFDRKKIFIATKVWRNNATADRIPKAAEGSLKRLDTDYVDLLYIHACWSENNIDDYIKGLNKAQDERFTKAIGVSNFNVQQLEKALSLTKHQIVALQNHYNTGYQHEVDAEMKKLCKSNNIMIVAYSPLESAFRKKIILELSKKYKKSAAQIALNWLILQDNVVTIPKAAKRSHIRENLSSIGFELERQDFNRLIS